MYRTDYSVHTISCISFQLVDRSGQDQHTKLADLSIRRDSRSESFLYNLQYNLNYEKLTQPSQAKLQPPLEDEDPYSSDEFETVSKLFSPSPGNSTESVRKRRQRRHARMHHEL